ncbi:uncharacterized protein LOC129557818 isoform X2 [Moschus berezovskii]|uniref:uncharacterized protein LOC129557818 isoform X2 n=1 Tax=Moschus berezovskii TaxID=68408 RepID=UPI0024446D40|nr:uncharacterized protein LOC129557818 isoform X2 [Moschus berezovskii]
MLVSFVALPPARRRIQEQRSPYLLTSPLSPSNKQTKDSEVFISRVTSVLMAFCFPVAQQEDLLEEQPQAGAEEPPQPTLKAAAEATEPASREDQLVEHLQAGAEEPPMPTGKVSVRTCQSTCSATTQKRVRVSPRWPLQDVKATASWKVLAVVMWKITQPLHTTAALRHQTNTWQMMKIQRRCQITLLLSLWKMTKMSSMMMKKTRRSKCEHRPEVERLYAESLKTWTPEGWSPHSTRSLIWTRPGETSLLLS